MKTLFVLTFVSPTKRNPVDGFTEENDRLIFTNKWMVKIEQDLFYDLYPHGGEVLYKSDVVVFPHLFAEYLKKINIEKGIISKFFRSYINRYVRKYREYEVYQVTRLNPEYSINAIWGAVVYIGVQDEATWDLWYDFFDTQAPNDVATYEFNVETLVSPVDPVFFWLEKDSLLTHREACALATPEGYLRACRLYDNEDYRASNGAQIIHTGQASPTATFSDICTVN